MPGCIIPSHTWNYATSSLQIIDITHHHLEQSSNIKEVLKKNKTTISLPGMTLMNISIDHCFRHLFVHICTHASINTYMDTDIYANLCINGIILYMLLCNVLLSFFLPSSFPSFLPLTLCKFCPLFHPTLPLFLSFISGTESWVNYIHPSMAYYYH